MHGIFYNINHFNNTHTLVSIFMFIGVCDRINPQIDIIGLFFQHVLVFNFTAYIYVGEIDIEFSKAIQLKTNFSKLYNENSYTFYTNCNSLCKFEEKLFQIFLDTLLIVTCFYRKLSYLQPIVVTPVLGNTIRQ